MKRNKRVGCFVSSHGFGHASRISAILQCLHATKPEIEFVIFGETPSWFWKLNLPKTCRYKTYKMITDVGLFQDGPFCHDLVKTEESLTKFLDFSKDPFSQGCQAMKKEGFDLVIADISPLGLLLGKKFKLPTVLIENFTWDWIYEKYFEELNNFRNHAKVLSDIYENVDLRIQCKPFCQKDKNSVIVDPVYRETRSSIDKIYSQLNLSTREKFVLLTTGGISLSALTISNIKARTLVVVPTNCTRIEKRNNLIFLPMNSGIHFPDLINSAKCVVGKAGYGTVCECFGLSAPFLAVYRDDFRESEVLKKFVETNLVHGELQSTDLAHDGWLNKISSMEEPLKHSKPKNGAMRAASHIETLL